MNYVEGDYGTAQTSLMTTYTGNMLSLVRVLNAYFWICFCREQQETFKYGLLPYLLSIEMERSTWDSAAYYSNLSAHLLSLKEAREPCELFFCKNRSFFFYLLSLCH